MKATPSNASLNQIEVLEQLIGLSVDLHNLNADVQRRWQLSIVQWLVLKKIIDAPGLSASSIAEISKVHPSTLTPTLTRLEGLGLIRQLERACDNRRKFIVASWKGLEWSRRSEFALKTALDGALHANDSATTGVEVARNLTACLTNWIKKISKTETLNTLNQ